MCQEWTHSSNLRNLVTSALEIKANKRKQEGESNNNKGADLSLFVYLR